ncbi:MAG: LuxR C-terminal-related transcriptional regulator [Acidimicrobiales bacterium]
MGQEIAAVAPVLPTIPNATVRREALLERLRSLDGERLVLVSAAAGSGKSALLASWAAELDVPVAWHGCQERESDHDLFWHRLERSVVAALAPHGMVGSEVVDDGAGPSPAERLAAQLGSVVGSAVIVIDDLHLAGATPQELVALIAGLPAGLRLVVATRVDPPFSLARMRVQGTLLELRQEDLRFDVAETAEALAPFGIELDAADLARLHDATEGWAAGVALMAISLQDRTDRAAAIVELAAHDRNLGDFLLAEVVDRQPAEVRDFLFATALLDAFDADLHDAVTGRRDGAQVLEQVRARNLFLVELDGTPSRYRYHHLVQEFLRLRHGVEDPDGRDRLHRRAASALLARGDAGAAVRHLLACGAVDDARFILAREITEAASVLLDGGPAVARRWLAEHGEAQLAGDPTGLLECTMALGVGGAHEEAERWLRRWQAHEPTLGHESRVLLHGAWSFHHLLVGDPEGCLAEARIAEELIERAPVEEGWRDSLLIVLLQALLWLDDPAAVLAVVDGDRARAVAGPALALVRLPAFAAAALVASGELRRGDERAARALAAADELGLAGLNFGRGEAELARAEAAVARDHLEAAAEHLERGLRIGEAGRPPLIVLGQLLAARIAARRGDREDVADAVARAREAFAAPSAVVVARIDEAAARAALVLGDLREAAELIDRLPAGPGAERLRARLALCRGDRAAAAAHLMAAGAPPARRRDQLDHGILAVLAAPPAERERAVAELGDLVREAAPDDVVAPFVDAGPALWDLLAAVPATGDEAAFVDRVLEAARRVVPVATGADQAGLVDPLSERELTVLRYLASRLDSSEIATALYVSVNTVRSHVKAIYRKLAVSSRPDAVARARELGLL